MDLQQGQFRATNFSGAKSFNYDGMRITKYRVVLF